LRQSLYSKRKIFKLPVELLFQISKLLLDFSKKKFQSTSFNSLKSEDKKLIPDLIILKKVEKIIRSYMNVNDNEGFYLEHAYFKSIIQRVKLNIHCFILAFY
jgi:hypothetical protein